MKSILCAIALILASFSASAGDFRGVIGYGIGAGTLEDDAGDELEADSSGIVLDGLYFLGESGPFFGVRFSQTEVGDFEVNGQPLGIPDQDTDTTSFTVGYRGGSRGQPQFFGSVRLARSDTDDGDDDDSTIFTVGVEKDQGNGRYEFSGSYDKGDDFDSFGVDATGFIYVSDILGLGASAGYSVGDGTIFGEDVDTTGWALGVAVEFRVFQ